MDELTAIPEWQADGAGLFPEHIAPEWMGYAPHDSPLRRYGPEEEPKAEEEDDFPAPPEYPTCPVSGTVTVTLADILSCGCQNGYDLTAFSGLLGIGHILPWVPGSSDFRLLGIGSFTVDVYAGGSCAGVYLATENGTFEIRASCAGAGQWTVVVVMQVDPGSFDEPNFSAFASATSGPFGATLTNSTVCGVDAAAMHAGTAVVSP